MAKLPLFAALVLTPGLLWAQNLLPNPSFEEGATAPTAWKLSGGQGQWATQGYQGHRCLAVTGNGQDSNYWSTPLPRLEPMATYRFSFYSKIAPDTNGGCAVSGPDFCNRDYSSGATWQRYSSVFCMPSQHPGAVLRLGQWMVKGTVLFDAVDLQRVLPVDSRQGSLTLGQGEKVQGNSYQFKSNFSGEGSNYARPLYRATADFNSSRWVFGPGNEVIYKQELPGVQQTSAQVTVTIGWYASGDCVIEASRDAQNWQPVGKMSGLGSKTFDIPAKLLPAATIYVAMRSPGHQQKQADFAPGSFQVHAYQYQAKLARALPTFTGATHFVDVTRDTGRVAVDLQTLGSLLPGNDSIKATITNKGAAGLVELAADLGEGQVFRSAANLAAGQTITLSPRYRLARAGDHTLTLTLNLSGQPVWAATTPFFVPTLYSANYGHLLQSDRNGDLWWCEGAYKVSQTRPAPTARAPLTLAAARDEYQPCQLIMRPKREIAHFKAAVSDLQGPEGATISHNTFTVRQVAYVPVTQPTDSLGCAGLWPDPLPPFTELDLQPGRNWPLWVTVKVPRDARPGLYRGQVTLTGDNFKATVPLRLRVYDFTMPAVSHLKTAWGFSMGAVKQYQNLTKPADVQKVFDLYMQDFREHRISPYDPCQLAPMKVTVEGIHWTGGQVVSDQAAEGQSSLLITDNSKTAVASAGYAEHIPIKPGATYHLSWAVRTAQPGQEYSLSLNCYDAANHWISGHNIDLNYTGSGAWEHQEVTLPPARFAKNCKSVTLTLRPTRWTEKGEQVGSAWFDDLHFGQAPNGPNLLQDASFEAPPQDVKIKVDFTAWDKAATRYLNLFGFNSYRLPVQFMGGGRYPNYTKGRIGPYVAGSPQYERLFRDYVQILQRHLKAKGWLNKAYIYWYDEPNTNDYPFVRQGFARLKRDAPDLIRMLTEQPEPALEGVINIWCPVTPNYNEQICQARQELGEKVWWYVCTGPKAPWSNEFIDHSAMDLRIWLWQTWKYKLNGCLIWDSDWWNSAGSPHKPQNPYEDPMSYTPTGGTWGNGDGRFLYPANRHVGQDKQPIIAGPVDSIRWEMLREGLQDWEYFYLLNQAVEHHLPGAAAYANLLQIPSDVMVDMSHFNHDPQPMYAHRAKLAEALEKLHVDSLKEY